MLWKVVTVVGLCAAIAWSVLHLQNLPTEPPRPPSGNSHLKDSGWNSLQALLPGHKVTLLNLWASWCQPCKAEFPALLKAREKYGPEGFELLFLSLDNPSDRVEAERFLASQGVEFDTYFATESGAKIATQIDPKWQGALPSSFLFDTSGKVIDSWQGGTTFEFLSHKIEPLLKK